jgi:hypothetical protein
MRIRAVVPALLLAVVVALALTSSVASAQEVGVKAGINVSSVSDNVAGDPTHSSRVGVVGGVFIARPVRPSLSLQAEALISVRGAKAGTVKTHVTYFEIPLLARLSVARSSGPAGFVFTGPSLAFKMKASESDGATSQDIGKSVNGFDLGWVIGAGMDFTGLVVDARYTLGLSNIASNVASAMGAVKNRTFALMAGIKFGK